MAGSALIPWLDSALDLRAFRLPFELIRRPGRRHRSFNNLLVEPQAWITARNHAKVVPKLHQSLGQMDPGNESPPPRTTILGSFLRGRPRNSSQSHIINTDIRELSPSPPQPPSPVVGGHRRSRIAATAAVQPSVSHQATTTTAGLGLSNMLRRRRSAGTIATSAGPVAPPAMPPQPPATTTTATTSVAISASTHTPPTTANGPTNHKIRLVPHIDGRRSLRFDAIGRDLKEGDPAIRIGRFTDRSGLGLAAINAISSNKLAFKSKVVSRAHAEIWVEPGPKFFIKDTKSSSGTFLNHMRLSAANTESRPHQMKDGDILQLGVDYQGGTEDIYKSVKIRIEIGREWQAGANAFKYVPAAVRCYPILTMHSTNALKNLKTLAVTPSKSLGGSAKIGAAGKSQIPDCCICMSICYLPSVPPLTAPCRPLRRDHPSSAIYRPMFSHLPLQMYPTTPRVPPPRFLVPALPDVC